MKALELLCFTFLGTRVVFGLKVLIPLAVPSDAPVVSPSLFSFSIEQDRWTDWAGTTSRNQFFFNVIDNLGQLTGAPPHIRIGADSEDRATFNADVKSFLDDTIDFSSSIGYPEATNSTIGDAFYQATQYLPPNTHVTWGVNLGQNNMSTAFLEAKSIMKAFSSFAIKDAGIVLDAIEIGNEADLYSGHGLRPKTYDIAQYIQE
ncbi:hypothetical protein H0H81_009664 [Sphagnurus paluster]|uniref:Glycoside hydrolase family 79 protein n=1 Tax=Sphagnurus paluster TaxID=117069 RepID=A0A9P7K3Z0_9AGAR|nr:hypothetical protein H0H81_009664 [Sphagnurus paluster]